MNTGDQVKFIHISAQDYDALEPKDPSAIYFITSEVEKRIAVGDMLFANYVPAHCTSLVLNTTQVSIGVTESFTLVATTEPADPSDPITFTASTSDVTITPTSSSNKVTVTGASIGSCVITATCGECVATCTVEVHREYIYVEHILAENYNPAGSKFKYTAPIQLIEGQYIEISIDLSTITGTKENILGLGENIETWSSATAGSHMQMYVTATNKRAISVDIMLNNKYMRPLYKSASDTLVVRVDQNGVQLNGEPYYFDTNPRVTPTVSYEAAIAGLTSLSSYDIGSQEGSNRSNATYNYIKYYTTL